MPGDLLFIFVSTYHAFYSYVFSLLCYSYKQKVQFSSGAYDLVLCNSLRSLHHTCFVFIVSFVLVGRSVSEVGLGFTLDLET